jgi:hypothetical protein
LAQKGKSGKMRSAFFVYKGFKPSHFGEAIARKPFTVLDSGKSVSTIGNMAWVEEMTGVHS